MDIFDREWCDAWIWTPNGAALFRIGRDRSYWASCYEVGGPFLQDVWSVTSSHLI